MNLARVLEQSTDDLPQVRLQLGPPRPHPNLVVKHHYERDGHYYMALIPGGKPPHYFRFNEKQWRVCSLFDGTRTAEQVSKIAAATWGIVTRTEDVQKLVDILEQDQYWYRTPYEESVALCQDLMQKRQRKIKQDNGDLSQIVLTSFDPDRLLTWMHDHFSWLYSRWFFVWSLFMLIVMVAILGSHWQQVFKDSVEYYHLTGRGFIHFLKFLGVFTILAFVHESAHGLTCKHVGGAVHRMGANLVYMAPCVFCDVSEAWVYGDRRERILTVFAGVWSEIVLCSYASVVWWATPPGTFLHDAAYLTILAGGIFCVMLNWNPLAKMDGYMMLTEFLRIRDVKVVATKWLISWIRKYVFHLHANVERISPIRAILYSIYAVLAGAYSYFLLLFFVRVLYHITYYYTPQWAFIPAGFLALKIFKSRLVKFGLSMKELYLDKKDLLRQHRKSLVTAGLALLVLGFAPLRREQVMEPFVLEPVQRAVLRAQVSGMVIGIAVEEGQRVQIGEAIATLHDLSAESDAALAKANFTFAKARAFEAQLRYADYGSADQKLHEAQTQLASAREKQERFHIASPISGTVITPRVHDLVGTYVKAGTVIASVADTSTVRARIFVPEHEVKKLQNIHDVVLRMDSAWRSVEARIVSISPAAEPPDPGLIKASAYKGMKLPEFFIVTVELPNPNGTLRDGMTGTAKIHARRRGFLAIALDPLFSAIARRVW